MLNFIGLTEILSTPYHHHNFCSFLARLSRFVREEIQFKFKSHSVYEVFFLIKTRNFSTSKLFSCFLVSEIINRVNCSIYLNNVLPSKSTQLLRHAQKAGKQGLKYSLNGVGRAPKSGSWRSGDLPLPKSLAVIMQVCFGFNCWLVNLTHTQGENEIEKTRRN